MKKSNFYGTETSHLYEMKTVLVNLSGRNIIAMCFSYSY